MIQPEEFHVHPSLSNCQSPNIVYAENDRDFKC